jgi:hypothetical protein
MAGLTTTKLAAVALTAAPGAIVGVAAAGEDGHGRI